MIALTVAAALILAFVEIGLKVAGRPERAGGDSSEDSVLERIPLSSEDWMFWAEWVVLGVAAFGFAYLSKTLKNEAVPFDQLWAGFACVVGGLFFLPNAIRLIGYDRQGKIRPLRLGRVSIPTEVWSGVVALLLLVGAVSSGVQVYGI